MENINEFLELPKSCYINTRILKKAFIDNPEFELNKEEKSILKEEIESIYLEYSLKPQFLNIPKFEDNNIRYEEIEIFKVKISNKSKYSKVCELIQRYIQYPMIIILENNNFIKINVAIKKVNKNDNAKLIVDKMIYTDWINKYNSNEKEICFLKSLSIKNLNTNNLFSVYEGYINIIENFIASKYKEKFEIKTNKEVFEDIRVLNKISDLENKVLLLKNDIKKEININSKVELNIKIKKIQKEIQNLKSTLS